MTNHDLATTPLLYLFFLSLIPHLSLPPLISFLRHKMMGWNGSMASHKVFSSVTSGRKPENKVIVFGYFIRKLWWGSLPLLALISTKPLVCVPEDNLQSNPEGETMKNCLPHDLAPLCILICIRKEWGLTAVMLNHIKKLA